MKKRSAVSIDRDTVKAYVICQKLLSDPRYLDHFCCLTFASSPDEALDRAAELYSDIRIAMRHGGEFVAIDVDHPTAKIMMQRQDFTATHALVYFSRLESYILATRLKRAVKRSRRKKVERIAVAGPNASVPASPAPAPTPAPAPAEPVPVELMPVPVSEPEPIPAPAPEPFKVKAAVSQVRADKGDVFRAAHALGLATVKGALTQLHGIAKRLSIAGIEPTKESIIEAYQLEQRLAPQPKPEPEPVPAPLEAIETPLVLGQQDPVPERKRAARRAVNRK